MAQSLRARPLAVILAVLVPGIASAQGGAIATGRMFDALHVAAGGTVCEIGAGSGELSIAAADRVGAQGRVYTSELGDERVRALQGKVAAANRPQIQVVAGDAAHTTFPDGACDALFMRNVYHHFETPATMNASIAAALKPGGRLAVVDFGPPPGSEAPTSADRDQDGMHGVTPATVSRELKAAGFEVIASESGTDRAFMVVAIKRGS
jgi:ubiquinone/menaquinone biosynthesis C-methylase UbiE